MRLQSWMHPNAKNGPYPYLPIITHKCPMLCKQLEDYIKEERMDNEVGDRPAKYQSIDTVVCLEYFAASFPKWFPVGGNNIGGGSPAFQLFQRLQATSSARKKPADKSVVMGNALTPYKVNL